MPLINKLSDTKLRSVSYGNNKPYITTDIVSGNINTGRVPLVDTVLNLIPKQINILGTKIDIKNSKPMSGVVDTARIANFLLDLSTGPKFIVKQVALQKMNVIPNGGKSTLVNNPFAGSTSFFGKIGKAIVNVANKLAPYPGQLYSPTNTLAQIALQGVDLHIDRAGLFPLIGNTRYETFFNNSGTTFSDTNSNLLNLKENQPKSANKALTKLQGFLSSFPILKRAVPLPGIGNSVLYSYQGGPESLGGIGITNITRAEIRKGIFTLNDSINSTASSYKNTFAVVNPYSGEDKKGYTDLKASRITSQKSLLSSPIKNPRVQFNLYKASTDRKTATNGLDMYNPSIKGLVYENYLGDKVTIKASGDKISNLAREIRIGSGRQDAINLTPLFTNTAANNSLVKIGENSYNIRDLIKFRIESINNSDGSSVFMVFRSYLTNFDDNFSADWASFKYVGRGENLYTYSGFSRSISIGFKVAALSDAEMKPMYQKLNYLASTTMPDYTGGYMKGNYTKMTVGNYLYRQIGVLTNVSYKISNDTPWEIAIDEPEQGNAAEKNSYELPHIIDVTLTFIPIGLQNNGNNLIPQKGVKSPVILQRDVNTWVDDNVIGEGIGQLASANYVGSDNMNNPIIKTPLESTISMEKNKNLYDTSALKMLDPNKLTPTNIEQGTPPPDVDPYAFDYSMKNGQM